MNLCVINIYFIHNKIYNRFDCELFGFRYILTMADDGVFSPVFQCVLYSSLADFERIKFQLLYEKIILGWRVEKFVYFEKHIFSPDSLHICVCVWLCGGWNASKAHHFFNYISLNLKSSPTLYNKLFITVDARVTNYRITPWIIQVPLLYDGKY